MVPISVKKDDKKGYAWEGRIVIGKVLLYELEEPNCRFLSQTIHLSSCPLSKQQDAKLEASNQELLK